MTATFNLEYRTNWGETVYLTGSSQVLGAWDPTRAIPMKYTRDGLWSLTMELQPDIPLEYSYFIGSGNTMIHQEWGKPRKLTPLKNKNLQLFDRWQNLPSDKSFFSSAFTKDIFFHQHKRQIGIKGNRTITLRCFAPTLLKNQSLALCGSVAALGNWNPEKAIMMDGNNFPEWQLTLDLDSLKFPLEYKFIIVDSNSGKVVNWEYGNNRYLDFAINPNDNIVVSGLYFNNPQPNWKGAGVAIPVFSLRSDNGFGIGEFNDLKKMVDWAVITGQKFIQILPINDTTMTHTWVDSYPYNANSIFALPPVYVNLESIGELSDRVAMKRYEE